MDSMPEQDELRRRLRAARALRDLTVEKLAERIPAEHRLGVRTLRKLESGERELTELVCRQLADYIGVPESWFTVSDVGEAVRGANGDGESDRLADRLAALESSQVALWAEIRTRRGSTRHERPSSDDEPPSSTRQRRGRQAPVQ